MKKNIFKLYDSALKRCSEKKDGDFMNERLRKLNGLSAERILCKNGQSRSVVVDLDRIINYLNISTYPRTFEDIEAVKRQEIAGLVLSTDNNIGIFYDADAPIERKRFIIAHELGHCCLHNEILKDGYIEFLNKHGFENNHEKEASVFAARLLIPEESLRDVYKKLILPSLDGLAEIFQVPVHIMEYRLKELKLKYFIIKGDGFVEP